MGISLETSGIKVGDDKCYLVNLNADPALNELLVYYLKVRICELMTAVLNHVQFPVESSCQAPMIVRLVPSLIQWAVCSDHH